MKTSYLSYNLVLPLILLASLCMVAAFCLREPWAGLAVNMAATFLGSIVTVFYIDVILKHHEDIQWKKVRTRVFRSVERIGIVGVTSTRTAFSIELSDSVLLLTHPQLVRSEMIRLADHVLVPSHPHLKRMDEKNWRTFAINLQGMTQEIDRLLSLFKRNLDADYMLLLLEIQDAASLVLNNYSIWPDLLGVPERSLPPKTDGSSAIPLQRDVITAASKEIDGLLAKCSQLLALLPPQSGLSDR
jgi:fluoride ion exporter CrcB/FEX